MQCPRCQHENPPAQKFCGECASPLKGASPTARSYADLKTEVESLSRALSEELDQQTATSEILRVISRSPTDIQPVLDTVAESAARLCKSLDADIFHLGGDRLRLVAHHGPIPTGPVGEFSLQLVRGTAAGRSVLDGRTIHVADMQAEADAFPESSENARRMGFRTILCIPLMREGIAIGVVALRRTEAQLFTERQIALLQIFADQAVIAIENVRLFKELQEKNLALTEAHAQVTEALERQTATSEILRVISSSPTDVQPVFDAIAESAARLCDAVTATVFRFDGALIHLVAHRNVDPARLDALRRVYPMLPSRGAVAGRVIITRSVVHVADVSEDPVYTLPLATTVGFRSVLGVPMLRDGDASGVILVARDRVAPFSEAHTALLKTFADQAVIAIENVRLFKELEARNRELTLALDQQTATGGILKVISSSPTDVQPVFEAIVRSAVRLLGGFSGTVRQLVGDELILAAFSATSESGDEALRRLSTVSLAQDPLFAQVVRDRVPYFVSDAETDSRVGPWRREVARARGYRSMLVVPMLRESGVIGAVVVTRREPGPFPDDQIALLQTFADQAVIAIENVRLFTELQEKNGALTQAHVQVTESLEQQTATSEILRAISSSPTDTQPVFDTIVRSAVRLCDALFGGVNTFDGELTHAVAFHNYTPDALAAVQRMYPMRPSRQYFTGRAILSRAVVHIPDVLNDPEYGPDVALAGGWRAGLAVPMLRDGNPIGTILVTRAQAGPFSEGQIELLKTFADQAVIAIENVRLVKDVEARTGELTRSVETLTALGEVSQAVSSTLDLETVLATIVSRAVQLSGSYSGIVYEFDEVTQSFHARATHQISPAHLETLRATPIRLGEGAVGRAAVIRQPVEVADIEHGLLVAPQTRGLLVREGMGSLVAVPLVREDQLFGGLVIVRRERGAFSPEVVATLRTFAAQSVLAIQNARLFREIADKSRQLEVASQHKSEFLANMSHELRTPLNAVIGFSEVLLQRMFGELNDKQDEYLKDIYASGQHLLSLINDILDLSKIEAGRMELAPAPFHLPTALENAVTLVKERAARHGIALHLDLDPRLGEFVGDERKVKQVLLNLLSNAVKFTPEGGQISLKASRRDGAVEVAVTDTGIGIAPEDQAAIFEEFRQVGSDDAMKQEGTGLGLTLAKKFVELHGGRIWVESEVGRGSTFTFTLPVS